VAKDDEISEGTFVHFIGKERQEERLRGRKVLPFIQVESLIFCLFFRRKARPF
jgi:hypothetical protein